ncbi:MAG: hypothetical protein VKQ33_11515 [Candidatus Sericytochromatia bacterium]|nr:hypothetical protein [Candidatus Sericytochromatia bacterium]
MRLRPLLALVLASTLALATGCARTFRLAPRPGPGQEVIWQQGRQAVVTADGWVALSVQGEKDGDNVLKLTLTVRNLALPRVDVIPTAIGVTCWRGGKPKALMVWDPDAYMGRLETTQALTTGALAVANALVASMGSTRTVTRTTRPARPGAAARTVTETVHDPDAAARRAERHERELKATREEMAARNAVLRSKLLLAHTLRPGEVISGQVLVEFEDADGYQVRVPLGGRTYVVHLMPARP